MVATSRCCSTFIRAALCCAGMALGGASEALGQFADDCGNAPDVGNGLFSFNLSGATAEGDPIEPSCAAGRNATFDQWVRYVAPFDGPIAITTVGLTTGDTVLSVHQDFCPAATWSAIRCNDDSGGPQSRIQMQLRAGEAVLVRVAGALGSRPSGSVRIQAISPLSSGDTCDAATPATLGSNTFDSTRATVNGFDACNGFQDVWFSYTAPVSGGLTLGVCGQSDLASVSVFAECGGEVLGCTPYGECTLGLGVQAGQSVLIRVTSDYAVGPEQFTLAIDPLLTVPNDNCVNAQAVALGDTPFDNTYATTDGYGGCSGGGFGFDPGLDLWYAFTPAVTGTYDFTTEKSIEIRDTLISLHSVCDSAPFACNDDARGFLSFIRTELTGGVTYLVRVAGTGLPLAGTPLDRGEGVLTVRRSIPPSNDECVNATTVAAGVTAYDVYDATTGSEVPSCYPDPLESLNDVWFRYVPTSNGPVEASLLEGGAAGSLSVFSGCNTTADITAGSYFDLSTGVARPRVIVAGEAGVPLLFRVAYINSIGEPQFPRGDGNIYIGSPTTSVIPNDACANATPVSTGVVDIDLTGSIKDCTSDPSPQFDSNAAVTDNDIFFMYTAPRSGPVNIAVEDGLSYPEFAGLVPSVYSVCGGSPIVGGFVFGDAPADNIKFTATAGETYIIRVGSVLAFGSTSVVTGSIIIKDPCPADITGEGDVDFSDFLAFFNCFDVGDPCGDIDGNPGTDFGDFLAFFNGFDTGC